MNRPFAMEMTIKISDNTLKQKTKNLIISLK